MFTLLNKETYAKVFLCEVQYKLQSAKSLKLISKAETGRMNKTKQTFFYESQVQNE